MAIVNVCRGRELDLVHKGREGHFNGYFTVGLCHMFYIDSLILVGRKFT